MYQDHNVLCAASAYTQKYFLNGDFDGLPDRVKEELQIMCVLFVEEIGGVISLEFEDDGHLVIKTEADEEDILYDEIGSVLKVKQYRIDKKELFESLETYYKVFYLGEDM